MRTIDFYIKEAKKRSGIKSNRRLAEFLGLSPYASTSWNTGKALPSDETMIKLAKLARVDPEEALIELNYWRAPTIAQKAYANILQKISHLALIILSLSAFTAASSPAIANNNLSNDKSYSEYYGKYCLIKKIKRFLQSLVIKYFSSKTCITVK